MALDNRCLLVFGGIDAKTRHNDVWLLDVSSGSWVEVAVEGARPPPRAHHTATRVGDRLFVFGGWVPAPGWTCGTPLPQAGTLHSALCHRRAAQLLTSAVPQATTAAVVQLPSHPPAHWHCCTPCRYAGSGKALGDLWVLQMGSSTQPYRWQELSAGGAAPTPRYDHVAALFPTSPNSQQPDKLVVMGGRDSMQQYRDVHVLDLQSLTWELQHDIPSLSHEVRLRLGS